MIWYINTLNINGSEINVVGDFVDSTISIRVNGKPFFEKIVNQWAHYEILAEDVYDKYRGKIKKIESKIPDMIKTGKLEVNKAN